MDKITRREFAALAAGWTLALTVLPSGAWAQKKKDKPLGEHEAGDLATEPFVVGPLADYRTPGTYHRFRDKGVWLVSDGEKLLAICSVCTHNGCPVSWNPPLNQFDCPCHKSRFTPQGIHVSDEQKAKRPLERCCLSLVDSEEGPVVRVDPTRRFVKNRDKNEFDQPGAFLPL